MLKLGRELARSGMRSTSGLTARVAGVALPLHPHLGVVVMRLLVASTRRQFFRAALSAER